MEQTSIFLMSFTMNLNKTVNQNDNIQHCFQLAKFTVPVTLSISLVWDSNEAPALWRHSTMFIFEQIMSCGRRIYL